MQEEKNVGINLIWAFTFIIVVGLIVGAVYYSGILKKESVPDTEVDINVTVPANK